MTCVEVGGWFASAFISKLVDKACSYLEDQYEYATSVKQKLKSLEGDLRKIQAVLHAAEQRKIENPALKEWLLDLEDAAYDAEDVLDMFEYKIFEDKAEGKEQLGSTSHRFFKRARTTVENIFFSNDDVNELGEVVDRFRMITKDMGPLIQLISLEPTANLKLDEIMQLRETTSMLIESQLFGRDSEIAHLMELLLQTGGDQCSSSSKSVHVLPVIGIGGVGKTALAQDVYNDQHVRNQFDLSAWVCVSDKFDVKRIAKEIMESARIERSLDFHNLQNLDSITEILKRGLTGKRFLIVLDDLWDEVAQQWERFLSILNSGDEGSKVIVTTRSQKVADMVGTVKATTLGGLEYEDFWEFFVHCAFGDENPEDHPNLEFFGKKIAKKLGGNPLAAKTVGAVLKYNLKEEHWREILESKLWQVDQTKDGFIPVLRLSYDYLPAHLKQCFVYCSLFPKNYLFKRYKLVQLWIAQGFIQSNEEDAMEEIGESYFNGLLSRSFFQSTLSGEYVIHDLLHDLAQYLSHGKLFRAEEDQSDNKPMEIPKKVRHVYISGNNLSMVCTDKYAKKNSRSLVVFGRCDNSLAILKELKGLRVLILDHISQKLSSESFSQMFHLRYLEITGNRNHQYKLPQSVCKLYHLQVLSLGPRIFNSFEQDYLPKGINRLINLRHLVAYTGKTAEIGTLTSLQALDFSVNKRESGYEIRQLRDMSQLRRLHINGLENVENKQEASVANLCDKANLEELRLIWGRGSYVNPDRGIFEGLRPHKNLKYLSISGYNGDCPSWWNSNWLSYLNRIWLSDCANWETLPPLGQLPLLKFLELKRMNSVKRIGPEFYGRNNSMYKAFPSLEFLIVEEMLGLMEWYKIEGLELFPRLSNLSVGCCPNLRGSLCLPSRLRVLHVHIREDVSCHPGGKSGFNFCCPSVSRLKEWIPWKNLASVEIMSISVDTETFTTELEGWLQHLTSLESLYFNSCYYLEFLPFALINSLSTLHELSLEYCYSIKSLPEEGLPTLLRVLNITHNSDLAQRCEKDGLDWHKVAHIPTIIIDGEEVER